jgi:thiamine phosphate phosphatase / amino-HMP aminohydrolase
MTIFLDFDGTITTEDSVTHLANFALRFQSERQQEQQRGGAQGTIKATIPAPSIASRDNNNSTTVLLGQSKDDVIPSSQSEPTLTAGEGEEVKRKREGDGDTDTDTDNLSSRWDDVVKAYVSDYKSHVSSYAPPASDRLCVEDEITFLRSQKHVETKSLGRINECALFRGISRDAFLEAGRQVVRDGTVKLRPGFQQLVRTALDKGRKVNVVSVNWSAAFIEGACGFAEGDISVYANEVRENDGTVLGPDLLGSDDDGSRITGEEKKEEEEEKGRNLTNCCDKRDVMRAVLRNDTAAHDAPFFYFGDSTTDMECLLEATRGIVIADSEESSLIRTLRRIGKRVPHVRDAEADDQVVWASDFHEVMASLEFGRL